MREIKFRGKRIDNGEWIEGYFYHEEFYGEIITLELKTTHICDINTIGQYTGLKDKNGKEIYEGDILDFDEKEWGESGYVSAVVWDEKECCFCFDGGTPFDVGQWRKVIGNIYDNPELLEDNNA